MNIEEDFQDRVKIPISAVTVFNFNYDIFHKLEAFEAMVKSWLITPSMPYLCMAESTTGLKRRNDRGAWMIWV
jgi:hypothetical protein